MPRPSIQRRLAVLLCSSVVAGTLGWLVLRTRSLADTDHTASAVAPPAPYGFAAHWDVPFPPDAMCATGLGPQARHWSDGPREHFARIGPSELCRLSLEWFEGSYEFEPRSGAPAYDSRPWSGHEARLELVYPSEVGDVTVTRGHRSSWRERIERWFEQLPPSDPPGDRAHDAPVTWSAAFEEGGAVAGGSPTAASAIVVLRRLTAADPRPLRLRSLELTYPSRSGRVTVRYGPESATAWHEHLARWFEHYPPVDESADAESDDYGWTVQFGDQGKVSGRSPTAEEATTRMRRLATEAPASFAAETFELTLVERRGARVHDCFSAQAERLADLDALPALLGDQRAVAQRLFDP